MRRTQQTANQYHPQAACEFRRPRCQRDLISKQNTSTFSKQKQTEKLPRWGFFCFLFLNKKKEKEKKKSRYNLEGKQAAPYGFQGLHLFFRVPLSGAEERKEQWREWRAAEGEKAKAGIIARAGTPYCGLTCLPAYSAFFSDNTGSPAVRKHEMFSHTC